MVNAVVAIGSRWIYQIKPSTVVGQRCVQVEVYVVAVGGRLRARLHRTVVGLVLVQGQAHGLHR